MILGSVEKEHFFSHFADLFIIHGIFTSTPQNFQNNHLLYV